MNDNQSNHACEAARNDGKLSDCLTEDPTTTTAHAHPGCTFHDLRAWLSVELIRLRHDEAPPHLQALLTGLLKKVHAAIAHSGD